MGRYIKAPISVDQDVLLAQAYQRMRDTIPGWEPSAGNLDVLLINAGVQLAGDLREIATDVPEEIFRYFGEQILLIAPKLSTYSSFDATVTASDTNGYDVPIGTTLGVRKPDGDLAGFQVVDTYSIPPGSLSVVVTALAIEPGSSSNALSTSEVVLQDTLPWVDTVVGLAPSSGGIEGETVDEYMDRLVDEVRLMAPRPIVSDDFGILVQRVDGIGRGYPLNLYRADTNTPNVEKAITVVVTDEDGEAVSSGVKLDALDLLQRNREVNFLVYVSDPQYQLIKVSYTVTAIPGYDIALLEAVIDSTLDDYLSPKFWGEVRQGTERFNIFRVNNMVRYLEVAQVINGVDGVDYITTLQIAKEAGLLSTVDVDITPASGIPVCLPRLGTLTGTVNAPV